MSWFDKASELGVIAVAEQLGLEVVQYSGHPSIKPCPNCGSTVRSKSSGDKRGPIGPRKDLKGFLCHRCKISGSPVDLVSYKHFGDRFKLLGKEEKDSVKRWFKSNWSHLETFENKYKNLEPKYPDSQDLETFWKSCSKVSELAACKQWLDSRWIDPEIVELYNYGTAITESTAKFPWATFKRQHWCNTGYRALFPLYNSQGKLTSVRARWVSYQKPFTKVINPAGYEVQGTILADRQALGLLRDKPLKDFDGYIVIAEGDPDYLTWATRNKENTFATFGVFNGSWNSQFASKIPEHSNVVVATHYDDEGEKYFRRIYETLKDKNVTVYRSNNKQLDA